MPAYPPPPARKRPRAAPAHNWPVGKTIQIDSRGAIKLARRFGEALICVRYRLSPDGKVRMTTVELEVEKVPVQKRANPTVSVKIYPSEVNLAAKARAKGAWFNQKTRLWRMHLNDAHSLGLGPRIALDRGQNRE